MIDGLIVAASMVLLDAARHQERAPALALWLLGAGLAVTLAVNVLAGVSAGLLGAIVAAWPALAFVGCYELLIMLVRASARRTAGESTDEPEIFPDVISAPMPTDAENAALIALRATLAAGNPLSQNQLMERFKLTRAAAAKVRQRVISEDDSPEPGEQPTAAAA